MSTLSPSSSPDPAQPRVLLRAASKTSRKSLSLDLTSIPPLPQPTPPSNTLLFTNLQDHSIFRPDNLHTIKELIAKNAPIHTWAPLKSFRRILISFYSEEDAIAVRSAWDGEAIMGDRCRVYFGQLTPVSSSSKDTHLALPDTGKLFFISPPPSPPHDWEQRLEGAPNKDVHAEDLANALSKLHHSSITPPNVDLADSSPISPLDGKSPGSLSGRDTRSRSSTLIFHPEDHGSSPNLPCVMVDDMTDEVVNEVISMDVEPRPIMAHTSRPPVELINDA